MTAPRLFISYCWSSTDHEKWVVEFATELCESGVDVILDKWDLREGHDAAAFMEKMVTDPEVNKVIIISDEKYAAKADNREGGVGTETQIISRKVYENQDQEKFVVVIRDKDINGKPFLPAYYGSRIYIDLSESERYSQNFEQLLRWIFGKPFYIKPEIGSTPSFLLDDEHISLGTSVIYKRCIDGIRNHKPFANGAFVEYCTVFASNLERFRITNLNGEYDDALIKNIEEFIPFRNEAIQLFTAIAQYMPNEEFTIQIHRLFESLIPYMFRNTNSLHFSERDFDNFKFIIHELFLYCLSIFLKYDRLELSNIFLTQQYYVQDISELDRDILIGFMVFRKHMESLDHRNKRLALRRLSLRADLLKERSVGTGLDFRLIMQADFIAFMRAEIEKTKWWPETLLYLFHNYSPFEIFARSVSKSYFNRSKLLLSIDSPKDLEALFQEYRNESRRLPHWDHESIDPMALLGYKNLAIRP